jgi:hypothetical protein
MRIGAETDAGGAGIVSLPCGAAEEAYFAERFRSSKFWPAMR